MCCTACYQFPSAAITQCHYEVQPGVLAGYLQRFVQFLLCIFGQHFYVAYHMQFDIVLIERFCFLANGFYQQFNKPVTSI